MFRKIKSQQEAQKVWNEFHTKYQTAYRDKGIEEKRQKFYSADNKEISEKFKGELQKRHVLFSDAATKIQKSWNKLRTQDTLVPINPKGNHTGEFVQLVNINTHNQNIKKSMHKAKIENLQQALQRGDWSEAIFADAMLPQLAMSLFAANKITQQQFSTILERQQIKPDFPILNTFKILDNAGQFTEEATNILIPGIQKSRYLKILTTEQLEDLRLLIAELPLSEQIFYIMHSEKTLDQEESSKLINRLVRLDSVYTHSLDSKDEQLVQPSNGVRDAIGLARFGFDDYIRPITRLGEQGVLDIEEGIHKSVRIQATQYPETKAFDTQLHDWSNVVPLEASAHDVYHSNVMSTIPKPFLEAFNYLKEMTRQRMGHKWSKEIWDWVDCDYNYFFHFNKKITPSDDINNMTNLFFEMLNYGNGTTNKIVSRGGSLLRSKALTPMGILAFIDMIKNPEKWQAYKIDPEQLIHFADKSDWQNFYFDVKAIYEKIQNDPPKLQVLKFNIYEQLKKQSTTSDFDKFNDLINLSKEEIIQRLSFDKITKQSPIFPQFVKIWANTIHFTLDKKPLTDYGLLQVLLCYEYQKKYPHVNEQSKELENFISAYTELGYHLDEAMTYSEFRNKGMSHLDAQFEIKPSLNTWIQANPLKTILFSLSVGGLPIILLYAYFKSRDKQTQVLKTTSVASKKVEMTQLPFVTGSVNDKTTSSQNKQMEVASKKTSNTSSGLFTQPNSLPTTETSLENERSPSNAPKKP